jgi:hypothetical protein
MYSWRLIWISVVEGMSGITSAIRKLMLRDEASERERKGESRPDDGEGGAEEDPSSGVPGGIESPGAGEGNESRVDEHREGRHDLEDRLPGEGRGMRGR